MDDISGFLKSLELSQYEDLFKQAQITMELVTEMDKEDFKSIGLTSIGHQLKIQKAAREKMQAQTAKQMKTRSCVTEEHFLQTSERENVTNDLSGSVIKDRSGYDMRERKVTLETRCHETAFAQVATLMEKISVFKSKANRRLLETYQQLENLVNSETMFASLKAEIETVYNGNIKEAIKTQQKELSDDNIPILVTGEVSAGKSSFINLLLGVDFLPQSSLSCTSTICRIFNKKVKSVRIVHAHDGIENIPIEEDIDVKDIQKKLALYCTHKTDYKFVDICWPFPFLNENIMIVDSPGIDPNNPDLTLRLFDYLPNALAFIYIINTPNGGGVQADRILKIKNELIRQNEVLGGNSFDPSKAIFICNKWDQVFESPDDVFEEVRKSLKENWPTFTAEQLFKLSTREEKTNALQGNEMSAHFHQIIVGIEHLIPAAIEQKIKNHIGWQKRFLRTIQQSISTRIRNTMLSQKEKQNELEETQSCIDRVKENLPLIAKRVLDEAHDKCNEITKEIYIHLKKEDTMAKMFVWKESQLPDASYTGINLINELEEIIKDRVAQEIINQMSKTEMGKLENYLVTLIIKECAIIHDQYKVISRFIEGHTVSYKEVGRNLEGNILDLESHAKFGLISSISGFIFPVLTFRAGFGYILSFLSVSAAVPVMITSMIGHFVAKSSVQAYSYRSNKIDFTTSQAREFMSKISKTGLQKNITSSLMTKIKEFLSMHFKSLINNQLERAQLLINDIQNDTRKALEIRAQCYYVEKETMKLWGGTINENMDIFGEEIVRKEDIKMVNTTESSGFFRTFLKVQVEVTTHVTSFCTASESGLIEMAEIQRLREIDHPNIVRLYGMIPEEILEEKRMRVYTELCDSNLDREVFIKHLNWRNCYRFLYHSLKGLVYLHKNGFVHKNVELLNIQIKRNKGKLSGGVVTKHKDFTGLISGVPDIMAPEIWEGAEAGIEADIFNFGLILWEAFYQKRAFHDEGKRSTYEELKTSIIKGTRPSFSSKEQPKALKDLIVRCWSYERSDRPMTEELLVIVKEICQNSQKDGQ